MLEQRGLEFPLPRAARWRVRFGVRGLEGMHFAEVGGGVVAEWLDEAKARAVAEKMAREMAPRMPKGREFFAEVVQA